MGGWDMILARCGPDAIPMRSRCDPNVVLMRREPYLLFQIDSDSQVGIDCLIPWVGGVPFCRRRVSGQRKGINAKLSSEHEAESFGQFPILA